MAKSDLVSTDRNTTMAKRNPLSTETERNTTMAKRNPLST